MTSAAAWTLSRSRRSEWDVTVVRREAEAVADDRLAELGDAALVELSLAGRRRGVRSDRRAASPSRLSVVLPVRRQSRGRERSGAGCVRARLPRVAGLSRPLVARDVALSDWRECLPESRQREDAVHRGARRAAARRRADRVSGRPAPASTNARLASGRRSPSCRASSARRSSCGSITSCLTRKSPMCWEARSVR